MGTKTIAFRLNSKNVEDKEIMDWLDEMIYRHKYYDSLTEALKVAVLAFIRGEIKDREEISMTETIQEFIRDYAKESRADNEKLMQDAVTRILATIVGTMGQQVYGFMPAPVSMVGNTGAVMPAPVTSEQTEKAEEVEKVAENNLELSDEPLDKGAAAALSAMFGDDED